MKIKQIKSNSKLRKKQKVKKKINDLDIQHRSQRLKTKKKVCSLSEKKNLLNIEKILRGKHFYKNHDHK